MNETENTYTVELKGYELEVILRALNELEVPARIAKALILPLIDRLITTEKR